jgi:uncharacterized protein YaiI (UPF0178 family)
MFCYFPKEAKDNIVYRDYFLSTEIQENGVLVIADAGPFFHHGKKEKLVEHELSMPSRFDTDLKRFCVFHKQDFNTLAEEQRQKLVNHHGQVLVVEDNNSNEHKHI